MKIIDTKNLTLKIILLFITISSFSFSQVTLRNKIGQMIIVGFDGTTVPDSLSYDLQNRNLGGVMFFASNITSPQQVQKLTKQLQQLSSSPLFIATDQEGGEVARLSRKNGFSNTYTAYQLGTVFNSLDSTKVEAAEMAQWLSSSGINVNFAPVADVDVNPNSPAIGKYGRSFSKFPLTVYENDSVFIDEMHKRNIITTLKHFPGHGSALTDSHLGFTDITNTWADSELIPYKKLLADNYSDLIMVGHLFNSHLDSLYPASLSYNTVTGLLRNKLGFNGVVITDDMMMGAITTQYTFSNAIKLAVNAGDDILLFSTNLINNKSLVDSVTNIILNDVADGKIASSLIDSAYNKIMNLKQKYLTPTSVGREIASAQLPDNFSISNYPNPFNPSTSIVFSTAHQSHVVIKVYNIIGQVVKEVFNRDVSKGKFKVNFNGSNLASGVYIAVMQTGNVYLTRKLMLLK